MRDFSDLNIHAMKIKCLKLKHWLLVSLGGLLGITLGCEQPDMYGTIETPYNDTIVEKNTPVTQYSTDIDVT